MGILTLVIAIPVVLSILDSGSARADHLVGLTYKQDFERKGGAVWVTTSPADGKVSSVVIDRFRSVDCLNTYLSAAFTRDDLQVHEAVNGHAANYQSDDGTRVRVSIRDQIASGTVELVISDGERTCTARNPYGFSKAPLTEEAPPGVVGKVLTTLDASEVVGHVVPGAIYRAPLRERSVTRIDPWPGGMIELGISADGRTLERVQLSKLNGPQCRRDVQLDYVLQKPGGWLLQIWDNTFEFKNDPPGSVFDRTEPAYVVTATFAEGGKASGSLDVSAPHCGARAYQWQATAVVP